MVVRVFSNSTRIFCCVVGIRNLVPAEIADDRRMTLNEASKFDDSFEFGKMLEKGPD